MIKHIDLSSMQSVRNFAADINATEARIDVLIHNAGLVVMKNQTSVDGIEMTMATNHYGPFLLTHLLIDVLKRSAPSRIVVVASRGHDLCTPTIELNPIEHRFPYYIYFKSKLANLYFSQELARRLEGSGVTSNSLHPGVVNTEIFCNIEHRAVRALFWVLQQFLITPPQGAETTLYVATAEEVAHVSGKYFSDCRVKKTWWYYENEEIQKKFFEDSQQMVGLRATETKI
jgi:retinol dehydrogenase 14